MGLDAYLREMRFRRQIVIKGDPDACWDAIDKDGQKRTWYWTVKSILAHRYSYELHTGPIPPGMLVLHRCDNPPCCNPRHLRLGTYADNNADRAAKGRSAKGSKHPNAVVTEETVKEMRKVYAECPDGWPYWKLAAVYHIGRTTARKIIERKTWRHCL